MLCVYDTYSSYRTCPSEQLSEPPSDTVANTEN